MDLEKKQRLEAQGWQVGRFHSRGKIVSPHPLSQGAKGNYLIIFGLILEKTLPSPCGRGAGGEGFSDFENALVGK